MNVVSLLPAGIRRPHWPTGRTTPHPGDLLLALVLLAVMSWEMATGDGLGGPLAVYVSTAVLMAVALAFRRRTPTTTAVIVAAAIVVEAAVAVPSESAGAFVGFLAAVYTASAHAVGNRRVLGGLALAVGYTVFLLNDPLTTSVASAIPGLVIVGSAWLIGLAVRDRQARAEGAAADNARLYREQEQREARAVRDERARIARELHDAIGHSVSVMVLHAGGGRLSLDGHDVERARSSLAAIEDTGRGALDDLRRLLGLLRDDGGDAALRTAPDITDLDELVEEARAAGTSVDLNVTGQRRPLPTGMSLCAYRFVQEGLTNVRKHAPGARAQVTVTFGEDMLGIEVLDDGPGPESPAGGGRGLVGMRERVAVYEGSFTARVRDGGGFAVRASLPLDPV